MKVGDSVKVQHQVTQEVVNQFAELTGDFNPLHVDLKYAAQSQFGQTIAHGALIVSFFSSALANRLPGPGTIYLGQKVNFKAPVFVGETVIVQLKVLSIREDKPIYTIETSCFDSKNNLLIEGEATVLYR